MLQSVLLLSEPSGQRSLNACAPPDTTRAELIAIFVKYIESHPEDYDKGFQLAPVNSIFKVYPCGKDSR